MTIALEKILTISADEWSKITGRRLSDYEARGVHIIDEEGANEEIENLHKIFASKVPDNAEVVVSYRPNISLAGTGGRLNYRAITSGTVLIPKEKK